LKCWREEKNQPSFVEGNQGIVISADRLILRQAFVNVIDNAVKYSPCRPPLLYLSRPAAGEAIVEVKDDGPGIAPEPRRGFSTGFTAWISHDHGRLGRRLGLVIVKWASRPMVAALN